MDRCPNCGATVRVGAKFCTTCGMRLPEPAATPSTNDQATRSPFDSTSTVASRWPSRSVYGAPESTSTETADEAPAASADEPVAATAEAETESAVSSEPSEPVATWGAWTAPAPAPAETTEETVESSPESSDQAATWGAAETDQASGAVGEATDGAAVAAGEVQEQAAAGWSKSGETDFLQLPEQPDPSAWKSIESQLSGAGEGEEAEGQDELGAEEIIVDEIVEDEVEISAPSSAAIERGYALLDELRSILDEAAVPTVTAVEFEEDIVEARSLDYARPSDEARARFAELREVVESAQANPRDFETMFKLTSQLDVIIELHDAHEKLYQAAFGENEDAERGDSGETVESGQE